MTTSEQQIRFEEKIQELRANQGKNVKMFSNKEYHDYIKKLKDMKLSYMVKCYENAYRPKHLSLFAFNVKGN